MKTSSTLFVILTLVLTAFYVTSVERSLQRSVEISAQNHELTNKSLLQLAKTIEELKIKVEQKPKIVYKTKIVKKVEIVEVPEETNWACTIMDKPEKSNRLLFGMGAGPSGLQVDNQRRVIKQKTGAILGIDYERKTNSGNVIGIGFGSNKTVLLKLGKDF